MRYLVRLPGLHPLLGILSDILCEACSGDRAYRWHAEQAVQIAEAAMSRGNPGDAERRLLEYARKVREVTFAHYEEYGDAEASGEEETKEEEEEEVGQGVKEAKSDDEKPVEETKEK